jgi:hypothetical protein
MITSGKRWRRWEISAIAQTALGLASELSGYPDKAAVAPVVRRNPDILAQAAGSFGREIKKRPHRAAGL